MKRFSIHRHACTKEIFYFFQIIVLIDRFVLIELFILVLFWLFWPPDMGHVHNCRTGLFNTMGQSCVDVSVLHIKETGKFKKRIRRQRAWLYSIVRKPTALGIDRFLILILMLNLVCFFHFC